MIEKKPLNKSFKGAAGNQLIQDDQMGLFFAILLGTLLGKDSDDFSKFFDSIFGTAVSGGFRDHLNTTIAEARANHSNFGETARKITSYNSHDSRLNIGDKTILDFIAKYESQGNYNIVYGGKTVNLTGMTIDEVIKWQTNQANHGAASTAAGRYQIIKGTLKGLKEELGLTGNELFDEEMQDRLGLALLRRRGLDDFMAGAISKEKFMRNLAQEWAFMPKDKSGLSYYHGDGLNKALTSASNTLAMLDKAQDQNRAMAERIGAPPVREHFDVAVNDRSAAAAERTASPAAVPPMLS